MMLEKRKERTVAIPTASMADIAFLLLAFFLVTTSLDLDKGLGLTLPPVGEELKIHKTNIITLYINETGEVFYDDDMTQEGEEIAIRDIHDRVRSKFLKNPKLIVSIHNDRNTEYQSFMSVLDQVKMAEVSRISIAEPET